MKLFAPLIALMVAAGTAHSASDELAKMMSYDGLEPVKVKGISLAYKRPGATLATYKRMKIDPVEVQFAKNWNPTRTGSLQPLPAETREAIRTDMAKLVYEQFAKALAAGGRYPIATESAADVLRLKLYVVNLYINAPANTSTGPSRTFVSSAGEMTLYMELFDSETGQILARVVDRQEARGIMSASRVTNVGEAEDIAAQWARIMRNALDNARAVKN